MIKLIAAVSSDGFIGNNKNELPWVLKEDLARFKKLTLGGILLMGRKTFESIGSRPLPKRECAVITRYPNKYQKQKNVKYFTTIEEALGHYINDKRQLWIAGGGQVYESSLPYVDKMYLTIVDTEIVYGIRFPNIKDTMWNIKSVDLGGVENGLEYNFFEYVRRNKT